MAVCKALAESHPQHACKNLSMVAYDCNSRLRAVEVTDTHWPVARSLVSSGFNKKPFLKEIRCSVAKEDKYIVLCL